MNRIQARSPFLIKYTDTDLVSVAIQLYVYTGTQDDITDRANGFLYQVDITPVGVSNEVVFDASEIIDSILDVEFDGKYTSQMVWVDYAITPTTLVGGVPTQGATQSIVNLEGYAGFRYFEEGVQNLSRANDTNRLLITNRTIFKGADQLVRIPVIADSTYSVEYVKGNQIVYTQSIIPSIESDERIVYVSEDSDNSVDNYKERIEANNGTYEESSCLDSFFANVELYDVDYILIDGVRVDIKRSTCSKYETYKVTFVNKFGALQDVYFDGKSSQKMSSKSESKYRSNTLISDSYSINSHTKRFVAKNGDDSMKLSTGFVSEDYVSASGRPQAWRSGHAHS